MPDFNLELSLPGPVVGLDEAGCGPWAGPVMAGAAILYPQILPQDILDKLNDSKKLTAAKRLNIYQSLQIHQGRGVIWASGMASVDEIDQLNIRQAALLAMTRAVEKLSVQAQYAIVDGIAVPRLACPVLTVVKGDASSLSIAAASIIAKVERDMIMTSLAEDFPEYKWEQNAGYGTAGHIAAIKQYGITCHHRKSFKPIAAYNHKCR